MRKMSCFLPLTNPEQQGGRGHRCALRSCGGWNPPYRGVSAPKSGFQPDLRTHWDHVGPASLSMFSACR